MFVDSEELLNIHAIFPLFLLTPFETVTDILVTRLTLIEILYVERVQWRYERRKCKCGKVYPFMYIGKKKVQMSQSLPIFM